MARLTFEQAKAAVRRHAHERQNTLSVIPLQFETGIK